MAYPSGNRSDYKSRLDMIRNPSQNHMSRTKSKGDRYKNKVDTTPTGKRRKRLYDGAYVAEVRRQIQSGFAVAGAFLQHLHAFVIDMDLTALYPSIMILLNLSPKTLVAKFFFVEDIKVPKYEYIKFLDKKEAAEYKCNSNDFAMECWQGKHWWALMEIFCKMPTTSQILEHIEQHYKDFT